MKTAAPVHSIKTVAKDYREKKKNIFFAADRYVTDLVATDPAYICRARRTLLNTSCLEELDPEWHVRGGMPDELVERMATLDVLEEIGRSNFLSPSVKGEAHASLAEIASRVSASTHAGLSRLEAAESYDALSALARIDSHHAIALYFGLPEDRRKILFAALVTGLADGGMQHEDAVAAALDGR